MRCKQNQGPHLVPHTAVRLVLLEPGWGLRPANLTNDALDSNSLLNKLVVLGLALARLYVTERT